MCLLTFMPEDVTPNLERFSEAAIQNPDGFGFAILESNTIIKGHSMKFSEVMNDFLDKREKHKGPAMFHFRWATHGSETIDNCHPFTLGNDPNSVVGHNGILPVKIKLNDKRSDTKVFATEIMPSIGGITALDDDKYYTEFEKWAGGNKLVFLTNNDDALYNWYIVNQELGHWDENMWWSNKSYVKSTFDYKAWSASAYPYSSGWSHTDNYSYSVYDEQKKAYEYDNIYAEEDWLIDDIFEEADSKMQMYVEQVSDGRLSVNCYTCGHQDIIKKQIEIIHTNCSFCRACLYCGDEQTMCTCWHELEKIININDTDKEEI